MNTSLSKNAYPSQDFIPIEHIRDGIIVLKDESVRAVLMASSINLILKSEDEQMSILGQFQNFLNSLDFSVQIFIQSRELDIRPYLALLESRYPAQESELMKIQVREYIQFIKGFVEDSSIMTKGFYVIVPYTPFGTSSSPSSSNGMGNFAEYRNQIEQRVSVVSQGLSGCGVKTAQLGTEEVIELFYRMFNMGELDRPLAVSEIAQ
jgi:type IV secretory pathway VirB4 component